MINELQSGLNLSPVPLYCRVVGDLKKSSYRSHASPLML